MKKRMQMLRHVMLLPWISLIVIQGLPVHADGPADNNPETVRPIPPPGMEVPEQDRRALLAQVREIEQQLQAMAVSELERGLVGVFPRAVRMTLDTQMFYSEQQIEGANRLLDEARRRIASLKREQGLAALLGVQSSPRDQPQLAVGGFRSKIDGSLQPYGVVLPKNFAIAGQALSDTSPLRLDVWLHGRGERVSECAFLEQRMDRIGEYAPDDTIVLHPYGRYSNAFKFAGEIDVLEAIAHVQELFRIDERRITIRGFSMGGAGCWQLAVHYPDLWGAANPGAGFSETRQFLSVFQDEQFVPTDYQEQLLHWYDCPDWTNNLRSVPTIAYSGEIDRQKQAADVMAKSFQDNGMKLEHIIGPQTAHKIHDDAKLIIEDRLQQILSRPQPTLPGNMDLTTYTLRYNKLDWLTIDRLSKHWEQARVQGKLAAGSVHLETNNVLSLKLQLTGGDQYFQAGQPVSISIDGQVLQSPPLPPKDQPWELTVSRPSVDAAWHLGAEVVEGLVKRPGLQGPIDDAFMDAFVFVGPDSSSADTPVERWTHNELKHATEHWKSQMRGDVRLLDPSQVTAETIADHHLVLFGTPQTNSLIAKISLDLPLQWNAERLSLGSLEYNATSVVPVLVYPNPLNPGKYIVLNSGFTFREYAYLNNARQISMLPDWALVDVSSGSTTQLPGVVRNAGFFDESWQFVASR
ncbi:MAG: prolyl oligopeptidase family serine peptidase [Planctomycetales bacterium]|nr:prolyl oligopeptidase family serine peptidase [Planctomycetales bacterium]